MNTLNNWCRMTAWVFLLILAVEGVLFGHNVASQVRSMSPQTMIEVDPAPNQEMCRR